VVPYATTYRQNRMALDVNSLKDDVDIDDAVINVRLAESQTMSMRNHAAAEAIVQLPIITMVAVVVADSRGSTPMAAATRWYRMPLLTARIAWRWTSTR
jgi:outer membrane usher protein FimD/PapC